MTAHDRNSKADTRGLFQGSGAAALAVDQSQWRTNLTNSTTHLTSTAARLGVRSPRELSVRVLASTGVGGIVLNFGDVAGTDWIYRIEVDGAAALVRFHHNGATNLATLTLPNIDEKDAREYLIHWSTEYDEFAVGYYSEMLVCDSATGDYSQTRATHTQPSAPAGGWQFNISGYGANVSGFSSGLLDILSVRVSCRFHSTTEAVEDWVDETATPSVVGTQPAVELAPVSPNEYADYEPSDPVNQLLLTSGSGGVNPSFAGPAELLAAVHAGEHRRRVFSPILNLTIRDPPELDNTYTPANVHREIVTGGASSYFMLGHVWVRPTPQGATRARIRVHVQTWLAAGAPGGSAVSVTLSMRTMTQLPSPVGALPPHNLSALTACTTDHGAAGVGEWIDLGSVAIGGKAETRMFFLMAHRFGGGTGASYQRAKIKHVLVEPYTE